MGKKAHVPVGLHAEAVHRPPGLTHFFAPPLRHRLKMSSDASDVSGESPAHTMATSAATIRDTRARRMAEARPVLLSSHGNFLTHSGRVASNTEICGVRGLKQQTTPAAGRRSAGGLGSKCVSAGRMEAAAGFKRFLPKEQNVRRDV